MFSLEALPAALYYYLFRRQPWIVSLHGDIEEAFIISRRNRSGLTRFLLKNSMGALARLICGAPTALFVSGPALAAKYAARRGDWLPFMDSGLREEDIFNERSDTCQSFPCRLMFIGEFSPRKGIDVLLNAMTILLNGKVQVVLRLTGSGDRQWVENTAKKLGIESHLEFTGYVTYGAPLFAKIREADILVVPSRGSEGWNRTITEANAQGLPVVATEVNSLGIAVREWKCGIVVRPEDPVSLAGAIRRIIESPEERRAMVMQSIARGKHYVYDKEFIRVRDKLSEHFALDMRPLVDIPIETAGR
jgi:glycosyltransferase involved in cell wall biosynthesis